MSRKTLEIYMHAFASLVSIENKGCHFSRRDGMDVCAFDEETGWKISAFLPVYERLLAEIQNELKRQILVESNLINFVNRQIKKLVELKYYDAMYTQRRIASAHLRDVMARLQEPCANILYPWGTEDHQIYIDFWHMPQADRAYQDKPYRVLIFDVGGGRYDRAIRQQYKPIEKNLNATELRAFIRKLIGNYNQPSTEELFNDIYGETLEICHDCVPEFKQTTGNCVVKNLLAAIKQDTIDCYGQEKGYNIFRDFYLYLIKATIIMAKNHAYPMFYNIPNIEKIAGYISESQTAFTGIVKHDLLNGLLGSSIRREYNSLRNELLMSPTLSSTSGTFFSSTSGSSLSLDSTSVCSSTISIDSTPTMGYKYQSGGGGCCA